MNNCIQISAVERFNRIQNKVFFNIIYVCVLGVARLSAPILSIFTIIDIGHFQNRFADIFLLLCKQTYYLQVTLFIGE